MTNKTESPNGMVRLVFKAPGRDEPGFFRRAIEVQQLLDDVNAGKGLKAWNDLVEHLSQYIDGPKEQIRDLLLDASKNQIRDMVSAITSGDNSDPFGLIDYEKI